MWRNAREDSSISAGRVTKSETGAETTTKKKGNKAQEGFLAQFNGGTPCNERLRDF
jgi:hypothetical protein